MSNDLTIILPTLNEEKNLKKLIPEIRFYLEEIEHKILIVDGNSSDDTIGVAVANDCEFITQKYPGFGGAVRTGIEHCDTEYVVTMDADLSHHPGYILVMWRRRKIADMIIASRHVKGATSKMPPVRTILSGLLNRVMARVLALPIKDSSSGYKMYRTSSVQDLDLQCTEFDIQQEIATLMVTKGYKIIEIPFVYLPRGYGKTHQNLRKFAIAYLKLIKRLRPIRNSREPIGYKED